MTFRNLTEDGDWKFGKGLSDYVGSDEEILLNIKTRLLSWKNDCFFNMPAGIDWKRRLDKNQTELLTQELRVLIIQSDGVASLDKFFFTLENRKYKIEFTIRTVNSPSITQEIEGLI